MLKVNGSHGEWSQAEMAGAVEAGERNCGKSHEEQGSTAMGGQQGTMRNSSHTDQTKSRALRENLSHGGDRWHQQWEIQNNG